MKTMIMKMMMLRVMTVIEDQMICIRNESRLDKTNKEIKGYTGFNKYTGIPKMSTFLIWGY